jgi:thiosulfate/3-mercaptopyruvate sulfurtransferase
MRKRLFRAFALLLPAALTVGLAADLALIQPKDLVARLQAKGPRPTLLHVGFDVLYRSKHIPNSTFAGPGNTPEGLAALKRAVAKLPRNGEIVIYCGCCPWDHCPNIKPAMEALRQMGFTNVKALNIPTNMVKDWYDLGYPFELGAAAGK